MPTLGTEGTSKRGRMSTFTHGLVNNMSGHPDLEIPGFCSSLGSRLQCRGAATRLSSLACKLPMCACLACRLFHSLRHRALIAPFTLARDLVPANTHSRECGMRFAINHDIEIGNADQSRAHDGGSRPALYNVSIFSRMVLRTAMTPERGFAIRWLNVVQKGEAV